jgi:hypothetical protein
MAWSPFQRSNAGITWVQYPGDYANKIPTIPATTPAALRRGFLSEINAHCELRTKITQFEWPRGTQRHRCLVK